MMLVDAYVYVCIIKMRKLITGYHFNFRFFFVCFVLSSLFIGVLSILVQSYIVVFNLQFFCRGYFSFYDFLKLEKGRKF